MQFIPDGLAVKSNSSKLNVLSISVARIILRHPTGYYSHGECWPFCVVIEILAKSVITKSITRTCHVILMKTIAYVTVTLNKNFIERQIKPEGEEARIVVVGAVRVRVAATRTMIAWCK